MDRLLNLAESPFPRVWDRKVSVLSSRMAGGAEWTHTCRVFRSGWPVQHPVLGGGGGYHQHHDLPGHTYPWPHTVSQFWAQQFPRAPRFHTTQNSGAGISGLLFQPLCKERTNTWGGATFLLLPARTTKVSWVEGYLQMHRGHRDRARISILQDSSPLPLQGQR